MPSALTAKDVADVAQAVPFVDMVERSFLRAPEDVIALDERLQRLGGRWASC
jgi:pyruvate kinase